MKGEEKYDKYKFNKYKFSFIVKRKQYFIIQCYRVLLHNICYCNGTLNYNYYWVFTINYYILVTAIKNYSNKRRGKVRKV